MPRFTLIISDELNDYLIRQAALNHRSKNKQIEHILAMACKEPGTGSEKRYTVGSGDGCYNGHHCFEQSNPAMSDTCNCGFFIFGEVAR